MNQAITSYTRHVTSLNNIAAVYVCLPLDFTLSLKLRQALVCSREKISVIKHRGVDGWVGAWWRKQPGVIDSYVEREWRNTVDVSHAYQHLSSRSTSPLITAMGLSMKNGKFQPPTELTPFNRLPKNLSTPISTPNLVQICPRGASAQVGEM